MTEPTLWDAARASREARRSIDPALNQMRARVLDAIRGAGARGMTDEECQDAMGMNPSTQRPRRLELVELGVVVETTEHRRTRSGRWATVYKAAVEVAP